MSSTRLPGDALGGIEPSRRMPSSAAPRQHGQQLVDLVVGLRVQRLALVERERAGELVAAALADVGDAVQRGCAGERGLRRPPGEGLDRGGDGGLGVGAIALRDRRR